MALDPRIGLGGTRGLKGTALSILKTGRLSTKRSNTLLIFMLEFKPEVQGLQSTLFLVLSDDLDRGFRKCRREGTRLTLP